MKKSRLYFDKKYKCVSFIVHYKALTLSVIAMTFIRRKFIFSVCSRNIITFKR